MAAYGSDAEAVGAMSCLRMPPSLTSYLLAAAICSLIAVGHGLQQDTHNPLEHIVLRNAEVGHHYHDLSIELIANVTEISGKSAWVEVSWSGFVKPSLDDWIGVIAPADAEVKDSTPVKYSRAAKSPEHMLAGRGSVTCVQMLYHFAHIGICFHRGRCHYA